MYCCHSQSFVLEHFVCKDTVKPENWLSALQVLTNTPRLSAKILPSAKNTHYRAKLSCLQSDDLSIHGGYVQNPSLISGANGESATIIMPVEGTVDFTVMGESYPCGPWTPFLLEANENFYATMSEECHLLIIQLGPLEGPGDCRPAFQRQHEAVSELLAAFLYRTPFFRDEGHAKSHLEELSAQLYKIMGPDSLQISPVKIHKRVRDERRLCTAVELMNAELDTDINFESVARRSGLSLRNFHYLMKQYIGQPPYQYVRGRRLIKVREAIVRGYPQKITIAQHALNMGFHHAGRFSAYYKKHFGEYPHETLSKLAHLKQMTDQVQSLDGKTGNISDYWITSAKAP